MKRKNFLKSVAALICVATLGTAALTGCGGEPQCEHVYTWTVHEGDESTCTEAGTNTGVCGICGDIKEEAIPLDPAAHDYSGEWTIEKPTEEKKGKAYKACLHNAEHKLEVELPEVSLSGKDYDFAEFVTVPTPNVEGEIHLELKHTNGVIAFNAPLAKRTLKTVEDAVIIASSLGANVRQSNGYFQESKDGLQNKFSTYYGDDYTSVREEGDSTETWYSRDEDGNMFAMSKEGNEKPLVVADPDEENLLGFHYQAATDTSSFYGAEQGLKKIYDIAAAAKEHGTCVNYRESKEKLNDISINAVRVKFSFSYFENPFFCRYDVMFETFEDGTLKKLEVGTEIIRSYMIATDLSGNYLFYKEGDGYEDDKGIWHKQHKGDIIFAHDYPFRAGGAPIYEYEGEGDNRKVRYEQQDKDGNLIYTTKDEAGNTVYKKVLGGSLEINPSTGETIEVRVDYETLDYVPELFDVYLTDQYGMELVNSKGEKIKKIMAEGGYPITDYYSDDHPQVNYRHVLFEQTRKQEGEEVIPNKYDSESLYIKNFDIVSAEYGGKTKVFDSEPIVLPTNTVIKLNIDNILPETAGLSYDPVESIYVIDPVGQRVELKGEFNVGSTYNIFADYIEEDEKILLNSRYKGDVELLFVTKAGKCEKVVPVKFTPQEPSALSARAMIYTVTGGVPGYTEQGVSLDSDPVELITGQTLKIWAEAIGEEAGYAGTDIMPFAFDRATGKKEGVEFSQADSNGYREWNLVATKAGTYIVRMPYFDGEETTGIYAAFNLKVTERPDIAEKVSGKTFTCTVQISDKAGDNPAPETLTAEFTEAKDGKDGVKNGTINISVVGNSSVYAYEISADGVLTAKYESGVGPTVKTYDFMFSVNDAGNLIISHSTGMGDMTEDIVLIEKTA